MERWRIKAMEIYKERQPISMPPAGVLLDVYCSCMFLELLALMKGSFLFLCMCQYSAYTYKIFALRL